MSAQASAAGIRVRRYDAAGARDIRDTVQAVYERSYGNQIASGNPFNSVSAFMFRFDCYASNPYLDLVTAYQNGEAIGQAWGWPLAERTGWWSGLLAEPEPGFTREDGHRTFALSEIMVVREYTGRGMGRKLHDELLLARPEARAALHVERDNERACKAYRNWGWYHVSQLRPDWQDAPTFNVLLLDLRRFRGEA